MRPNWQMVGSIVMETPSIRQPTSELLRQFGGLLFAASIISITRPSHVCSSVSVTTSLTPMNRSQNSTYPLRYWNPGCGTVSKSNLVTLPSNERDKCLLDVERGAVALTVERKQHIALTTQVEQLLQLVWAREIPHRYPHDYAIGP